MTRPHRAITRLKPQNLHFFPRIRHRRPFLYLAPCGPEWQKTLDYRAFCHCGPFLVLARCGPAEAFELHWGPASVPPIDRLQVPQLRAAMLAVYDELMADAAGSRLCQPLLERAGLVRRRDDRKGPSHAKTRSPTIWMMISPSLRKNQIIPDGQDGSVD
jgi:hypothetical protein